MQEKVSKGGGCRYNAAFFADMPQMFSAAAEIFQTASGLKTPLFSP